MVLAPKLGKQNESALTFYFRPALSGQKQRVNVTRLGSGA
jgi:hypothetical protein